MGIVNRRNAVLGWAAWKLGKRAARRKARSAVPGTVDDTKRPNKSALALLVAGVVGALTFWRRQRSGDDQRSE
jgi:MYXO-CTERM domain-containing protein